MKKIFALLLTVTFVIALTSCSDDSTNPSNPNYFPLQAGNYWVYDYYTLDSNNTREPSSHLTDSAYISGTLSESVLNLGTVTTFSTTHAYSDNSSGVFKNYATSDAVYQFMDKLPGMGTDLFGMNLSEVISVDWVKYIDLKNSSWVIAPADTIEIPEISLSGARLSLKIIFNITGSKGSSKSFTIDSKSVSAQDYVLSINISGEAKSLDFPILPAIPIASFSVPTHYYLADGIGLVSTKTESTKVKISTYFEQTMPGSERILVRYNVQN
ncbi:MAG: hypothetical protein A2X64_04110 [Ignavibacteria bacterium GWF2_33_9]|nr:MAG: hypothetical protein A2X64_04110 [Ignavibacteria bacterium GWF2_33_9]